MPNPYALYTNDDDRHVQLTAVLTVAWSLEQRLHVTAPLDARMTDIALSFLKPFTPDYTGTMEEAKQDVTETLASLTYIKALYIGYADTPEDAVKPPYDTLARHIAQTIAELTHLHAKSGVDLPYRQTFTEVTDAVLARYDELPDVVPSAKHIGTGRAQSLDY